MASKKKMTLEQLLTIENLEEVVNDLSFEQGLALMEELVEKVESGTLELDRAVNSYERGALVLKHLRKLLEGAEEKLRMLNEVEK